MGTHVDLQCGFGTACVHKRRVITEASRFAASSNIVSMLNWYTSVMKREMPGIRVRANWRAHEEEVGMRASFVWGLLTMARQVVCIRTCTRLHLLGWDYRPGCIGCPISRKYSTKTVVSFFGAAYTERCTFAVPTRDARAASTSDASKSQ